MDKEQAKFILQSFRPNGEDASDVDFKEALKMAVEDRELGEWLADERAADAQFAAALNNIEIPEQLRLNLLAVMHGEDPDDQSLHEEMDELLSGALAGVQPPEGLRDQIIAAMELEKHVRENDAESKVIPAVFNRRKWLNVAAIAAALVLGVFFATQVDFKGEQRLASYDVQQSAGRLINASFDLDVKDSDSVRLTSWLADNNLPAPTNLEDLPPGLRSLSSIGCKKLTLPGKEEASLICLLSKEGKPLHLVVVKNESVSDKDLPTRMQVKVANCYHCPVTEWNVVRWRDENNTYVLMSKTEATRKDEMVQYF